MNLLFFVLVLLQHNSFAQCTYIPENYDLSNTFKTSDIPILIKKSQGCTTLVELWASWCGPCRMIVPKIDDLVNTYPDIIVHQISADEKEPAMKRFISRHPLHSPPYRLSTWTIADLKYSFSQIGGTFEAAIPYIILLDPDGNIVAELTEPKDLQVLENYLSKNPPPKKENETNQNK